MKWYIIRNKENAAILNAWENKREGDNGAHLEDAAKFFSEELLKKLVYILRTSL